MKYKIEEGDIVLYITMQRIEVGRVARIVRDSDKYHIVPLERGHFAKKRKYSELLPFKKIQDIIGK